MKYITDCYLGTDEVESPEVILMGNSEKVGLDQSLLF